MTLGEATLLVDISNTRTKFAVADAQGALAEVRVLPTEQLSGQTVQALLQGLDYGSAWVSSVVPSGTQVLQRSLPCPVHVLHAGHALNLELGYRTPETLGADRLAAAMYLADSPSLPAIAIDAGTAVTFDVVTLTAGRPYYAGGAIAPGLRSMMQVLVGKTACLPEIPLELPPAGIGRDTVSCMQTGLVVGFVEMVKGVLSRLSKELDATPRVVLTGGDAPLLAPYIPGAEVDKCLVFKGLCAAARLNR